MSASTLPPDQSGGQPQALRTKKPQLALIIFIVLFAIGPITGLQGLFAALLKRGLFSNYNENTPNNITVQLPNGTNISELVPSTSPCPVPRQMLAAHADIIVSALNLGGFLSGMVLDALRPKTAAVGGMLLWTIATACAGLAPDSGGVWTVCMIIAGLCGNTAFMSVLFFYLAKAVPVPNNQIFWNSVVTALRMSVAVAVNFPLALLYEWTALPLWSWLLLYGGIVGGLSVVGILVLFREDAIKTPRDASARVKSIVWDPIRVISVGTAHGFMFRSPAVVPSCPSAADSTSTEQFLPSSEAHGDGDGAGGGAEGANSGGVLRRRPHPVGRRISSRIMSLNSDIGYSVPSPTQRWPHSNTFGGVNAEGEQEEEEGNDGEQVRSDRLTEEEQEEEEVRAEEERRLLMSTTAPVAAKAREGYGAVAVDCDGGENVEQRPASEQCATAEEQHQHEEKAAAGQQDGDDEAQRSWCEQQRRKFTLAAKSIFPTFQFAAVCVHDIFIVTFGYFFLTSIHCFAMARGATPEEAEMFERWSVLLMALVGPSIFVPARIMHKMGSKDGLTVVTVMVLCCCYAMAALVSFGGFYEYVAGAVFLLIYRIWAAAVSNNYVVMMWGDKSKDALGSAFGFACSVAGGVSMAIGGKVLPHVVNQWQPDDPGATKRFHWIAGIFAVSITIVEVALIIAIRKGPPQ